MVTDIKEEISGKYTVLQNPMSGYVIRFFPRFNLRKLNEHHLSQRGKKFLKGTFSCSKYNESEGFFGSFRVSLKFCFKSILENGY